MTYIYSLSCPWTYEIRYIGRTTLPNERKRRYLSAGGLHREKNKNLFKWIQDIRDRGALPIFTVIDICDDRAAADMEQIYITKYVKSGRLFNIMLTSSLHDEIDYNHLRQMAKKKKIRYQALADKMGVSYCSIAGYLTGQRCQLSLSKARDLRELILRM